LSIKFVLFQIALCFLARGLDSTPILAATPTTSFGVTATVQAGCLISATAIPFGNYPATVVKAKPEISVTCTNLTAYIVDVRAGLTSSATAPTRRTTSLILASPSYPLVSNTQGIAKGDLFERVTKVASGSWNISPLTLSVSSQLSPRRHVGASPYSETVILTVTY
jgi:spore coat protein U-like protein